MSLEVRKVTSGYFEDMDILHEVSIDVKERSITTIIGPNGAGKSTLLKTIYGFLRPKAGGIFFSGDDITGTRPEDMLRRGIWYTAQLSSVFPQLTVEENIRLAAWTVRRQLSSSELDKRALEIYEKFPSLNAARQKKAAFLSGGQRRMLEISKCLMVTPSLVLIDEPTAGLAPKIAKDVYDKLAELNRLGMTILFVDQNIRQAVKLADYVYLLELGTNKLEAPGEQFRSNINQMIGTYVLGSEESYAV